MHNALRVKGVEPLGVEPLGLDPLAHPGFICGRYRGALDDDALLAALATAVLEQFGLLRRTVQSSVSTH